MPGALQKPSHGLDEPSADGPGDDGTGQDAGGTQAVILAGGRGTRLAPYTSVLPKPLMPIGERTILETVVEQLDDAGLTVFSLIQITLKPVA